LGFADMGIGEIMAASFPALDRRIIQDLSALHDFLWQGRKEEASSFASKLLKDAHDADAFLHLGGRLARNAKALAAGVEDPGKGESLFELLEHAWALGAANQLAAKKDYRGAAIRAKDAVSSATIGVCANAGCFEFVEEWESGKIDFETFTKKVTDFLEPKGVLYASQFKRVLDAVHDIGTNWNAVAGKGEQAIAARAVIVGCGWCLLTSVSIRELLGAPPKFQADDFRGIVERIVGSA
jgi:hypothetical protein